MINIVSLQNVMILFRIVADRSVVGSAGNEQDVRQRVSILQSEIRFVLYCTFVNHELILSRYNAGSRACCPDETEHIRMLRPDIQSFTSSQ